MDQVAQLKSREIAEILFPTVGIFIPVLEEKRAQILHFPKRTFKYGPTERHQLDIYYPLEPPAGRKTPVLFFVYGGGFWSGAKQSPPPADLSYANLATYFAQKGFITIIADYRLSPEVIFPAPVEDVRDAMLWIVDHPENLIYGNVTDADTDAMFLMGHSAGASAAAALLLLPQFSPPALITKLKGVILMSGMHYINDDEDDAIHVPPPTITFWGGEEGAKAKCSLSLLNNASKEQIATLPKILLVESEWDPDAFILAGRKFQEVLSTVTQSPVKKVVAKGHNHISVTLALWGGQGEQWAEEVFEWTQTV